MAWALVGTIGAASQGAASADVTPAWGASENRTAGNLLICFVGITQVQTFPSTPVGWYLVRQVQTGTTSSASIFARVAEGTDAAPTIAGITNAVIAAQLAEFSGVLAGAADKTGTGLGTGSPITATFNAASAATSELWLAASAARYSVARSPTTTLTSNHVTTVTNAGNNSGTSSKDHYHFGYGTTNSISGADTAVLTLSTTTSLTTDVIVGATFKLGNTRVSTFTGNAVIKGTPEVSFTANAVIKKTITGTPYLTITSGASSAGTTHTVGQSGQATSRGQAESFTALVTGSITGITTTQGEAGSPSTPQNVGIMADSSGVPSGTFLDSVSDSGTGNPSATAVSYVVNASVTAGSTYWVATTTGSVSPTNYYLWYDTAAAYSGGAPAAWDGTTWSTASGYDATFVVYNSRSSTGFLADAIARKATSGSCTADAIIKKTSVVLHSFSPATSGDDVEEEGDSTFSKTNAVMKVGIVAAESDIAIRFPNFTITRCEQAYLSLVTTSPRSNTGSQATIQAYAEDNSAQVADLADMIGRPMTLAASSLWTIGAQTSGVYKTSPNIASVVNEVTSRSGWASGNAIQLYLFGASVLGGGNTWSNVDSVDSGNPTSVLDVYVLPSFTANAFFRKTFTADAVIGQASTTVGGSFTANAVLFKNISSTKTADAVLFRTISASATADAVIRRTQSASATADAVLKRTISGSFTADAITRKTATGSALADAVIKRTQTGSATADAVLKKTISGSATADAVLAVAIAKDTFTRSSSSGWGTADLGGSYSTASTLTDHTVDGSKGSQTLSSSGIKRTDGLCSVIALDQDIRVRVAVNKVPTGNNVQFVVGARSSNNTSTPARDGYAAQVFINTNATINGNFLRFAASDGTQTAITTSASTGLSGYTANTWVWIRFQALGSNPTTLNMKVWYDGNAEPSDWTFSTTDSNADQQDAGAMLLGSSTSSGMTNLPLVFSFDDLNDVSYDAPVTGSFTANAVFKRTISGSATADAVIKATASASFAENAVLLRTQGTTYAADAIVKRIQTGTPIADAVVKRTISGSATADAVTQRIAAGSATADAVIKRSQASSATADAVLLKAISSSAIADATVQRNQTGSATASAVITTAASATFTANAVIKRNQAGTYTADAIQQKTAQFTATYPTLYSADVQQGNGSGTDWTLTYPTHIAAGDLLVMMAWGNGAGFLFDTLPAGWVLINAASSGGFDQAVVAAKIATGSESGAFATSTLDDVSGGWYIARVGNFYGGSLGTSLGNNADGVSAALAAGTSVPPSLNPAGWDVASTLWMGLANLSTVTGYPANMPDNNQAYAASYVDVATANSATASFTPNAFTGSTLAGLKWAVTIAVRPPAPNAPTADALISKTNSFSNKTANAVIKRNQTGTFSANAVVKRAQAGSATGDAVFFKTASGSFTENSVLLRTQSATFTGNAIARVPRAGSVTADAAIAVLIAYDNFDRTVAPNSLSWGRSTDGSFEWRVPPFADYGDPINSVDGSVGIVNGGAGSLNQFRGYPLLHSGIIQFDVRFWDIDAYGTGNNAFDTNVSPTQNADTLHIQGWSSTELAAQNSFGDQQIASGLSIGDWVTVQIHVHDINGTPSVIKAWKRGDPEPRGKNSFTYSGEGGGTIGLAWLLNTNNRNYDLAVDNVRWWTSESWTWIPFFTADAVVRVPRSGSFTADAVILQPVIRTDPLFVGYASAANNTVALPAGTRVGDIAIVMAYRNDINSGPDYAVGWTHADGSGNFVTGFKTITASDTTIGTWTNATQVEVVVYTNFGGVTEAAGSSGSGVSTNVMTWSARTNNFGNTTYVLFGGHQTATNVNTQAPAGSVNRSSGGSVTNIMAADTAPARSYAGGSITVNASGRRDDPVVALWPLTAQSIFKAMRSSSFTADAVIRKVQSPTYTADAQIIVTTVAGYAADAVLFAAQAGTFSANAFVAGTNTYAFSLDAVLKKAESASFAADALALRTMAAQGVTDAILLRVTTGQAAADADIKATLSSTKTADAVVSKPRTGSASADAVIKRTQAGSLAADTILLKTATPSATANADIKAAISSSFTEGAIVQRIQAGSYSADAIIAKAATSSLSAAAALLKAIGGSFAANAVILRAASTTFVADAIKRLTTAGSASVDAVLLRTAASTAAADAQIIVTTVGNPTANAVMCKVQGASFLIQSFVQGTGVSAFNADADIKAAITAVTTADAVVQRAATATFTADAVIKRAASVALTGDAVVERTIAGTFTGEGTLLRVQPATFLAGAVLAKSAAASFTVDALPRIPQLGAATASAIVLRAAANTATADAQVIVTTTAVATGDAVVLRSQDGTATISSFIAGVGVSAYTIDAVLFATLSASYSENAVIQRSAQAALTADAIANRVITATLDASAVIQRQMLVVAPADAVLARAASATFAVAAVIATTAANTFSASAIMQAVGSGSAVVAAVVLRAATASPTVDAVLGRTATATASADAYLYIPTTELSFTAAAIVRRAAASSITAGAWIQGAGVSGLSADAIIRRSISVTYAANAVVRVGAAGSATANAVVLRAVSNVLTVNAIERTTTQASATASATVRISTAATFTIDAYFLHATGTTFSANAVLLASRVGSTTANAVSRSTQTHGFVLDAYSRRISSGTLTASAVLQRSISAGSTGNAVLLASRTDGTTVDATISIGRFGTVSADAQFRRVHSATFSAAAEIAATPSFTADAWFLGIGEQHLKVDAVITVVRPLFASQTLTVVGIAQTISVVGVAQTVSVTSAAQTLSVASITQVINTTGIAASPWTKRTGSIVMEAVISD